MSTRRAKQGAWDIPVERDDAGKPLCRWCHGPVAPPRRTFCSDACVDEWKIRTSPGIARRLVEKRDHGICAGCGLDTERLNRIAGRLTKLAHGYQDWHQEHAPWVTFPSAERRRQQLDILVTLTSLYLGRSVATQSFLYGPNGRVTKVWTFGRHLWEADHIKPVVEGGGECGLENLRTLCLRCHKHETAKLASRRALARDPQQQLFPTNRGGPDERPGPATRR